MADPAPALAGVLVGFGRALRAAGVPVGAGDLMGYCSATGLLDAADLTDVYWAGRATLVHAREDIPRYDVTFREYFLGETAPASRRALFRPDKTAGLAGEVILPATEPGAGREAQEETRLGLMASDVAVLRHRSFAACTADEMAALRRIMTRIALAPPRRRTRRTERAPAGRRPDVGRTLRASMRAHGEVSSLYWRRRRDRPRPLVLILDISGSMADYSRHLLQFAYSARRAASAAGTTSKVEVFCFGTRLTRVTDELARRRPDDALRRAAAAVVDWDGGTRIGESLRTFVRRWGRTGWCRSAVVVICSDGLDRGSPQALEEAVERLSRLCYRIVWLNPHHGGHGRAPDTVGMLVAAPHIDLVLSCRDLASLEELAMRLPALS